MYVEVVPKVRSKCPDRLGVHREAALVTHRALPATMRIEHRDRSGKGGCGAVPAGRSRTRRKTGASAVAWERTGCVVRSRRASQADRATADGSTGDGRVPSPPR
ncbi:hypothetical protein GCM10022255_017960 [Dactylosporangium darangshiense]|uniref:Uncharacterized protein n=1 Tax=Dactylosporangium darangshiense TaxID=579108 RepID=A0ABP8D3A0_9ACTN